MYNQPKVVLINPPSPWLLSDREHPPDNLLTVAAFLREKGVNVQFCDLNGMPENYWFIPHGDIYGVSCATPHYPIVIKIVAKLKARQKNALVVLGGFHPTVEPERTLRDTKCDIVVVGEGEQAFLDVVNGKRDRIVSAPLIENIDDIPMPAWDLVDMDDYVQMGTNSVIGQTPNNKEAKLQTARGCPFDCAFCAQSIITKRRMRYKSIERVVQEVKHVHDTYGVDRVNFFDDTFIVDDNRVRKLCAALKELKEQGILYDWHCLTRADKTDLELFKLMKDAGCSQLTYGIESGSQKILDIVGKQTTVEENINAIKVAKAAGLKVRAQMIVGLPGETQETVEETAKLIREAPADSFGMHIFVPLPGCRIWKNPEKFDFPIDKDTTFEYYHTIGKRTETDAANLHRNPQQIIEWKNYLVKVMGERDIVKFAEIRAKKTE